jgi:3-hydroxybutyryl-CoA dehydrogenase
MNPALRHAGTAVALVGSPDRIAAVRQRLPQLDAAFAGPTPPPRADLDQYRLVLDLTLDEHPERIAEYARYPELTLWGCAVKRSLAEMAYPWRNEIRMSLLGLNALPTFLERSCWESSVYRASDRPALEAAAALLGVETEAVWDEPGMVTPRVLFLIINEACLMLDEGAASAEAIETAMRLGLNYPQGPLAWADRIGPAHICEVLDRLRALTGDARWAVAPRLRRAMLTGSPLAPVA